MDDFNNLESQFRNRLNALVLQDRFMSEVDTLMEAHQLNKKELAKKLNVSSSYITQVFKGKKFLNFYTLSKLQEIFNIEFKIQAVNKAEIERDTKLYCSDFFKFTIAKKEMQGILHQGIKPNYDNFPGFVESSKTEKIEKAA